MKFNKKMVIMLCTVIAVFLFIIVLAMIFTSGSNKIWSYSTMENKIIVAGKNYYSDNKNELPETGTVSIDVSTLVAKGYLSDLSKHSKDGVSCSGKLYVSKNPVDYSYRVNLDCGDKYSTSSLKKAVMKNLVTSGNGLYEEVQANPNNSTEMQTVYVFKGENVNNYIKIGKTYFQIVKVYENGEIAIIDNGKVLRTVWDDRFNIETNDNKGVNNYSVSRVKDSIENDVLNNTEVYTELKTFITSHTACIAKKGLTDTSKDGSVECSETLENQYFSLLPVYDFMNASLDDNCNETMSKSCYNYNYLSKDANSWWTVTGVLDNNQDVYYVSGSVNETHASNTRRVRLYAHLDANVTYVSGTGSYEDPYILK